MLHPHDLKLKLNGEIAERRARASILHDLIDQAKYQLNLLHSEADCFESAIAALDRLYEPVPPNESDGEVTYDVGHAMIQDLESVLKDLSRAKELVEDKLRFQNSMQATAPAPQSMAREHMTPGSPW